MGLFLILLLFFVCSQAAEAHSRKESHPLDFHIKDGLGFSAGLGGHLTAHVLPQINAFRQLLTTTETS